MTRYSRKLAAQPKPAPGIPDAQCRPFNDLVTECADAGRKLAQHGAMRGIVGPLRLAYARNALTLYRDTLPDGFTDSGRELSAAVEYGAYWKWVSDNARDLPVYA